MIISSGSAGTGRGVASMMRSVAERGTLRDAKNSRHLLS